MSLGYALRYVHAMEIGPDYYVDKEETKEEFPSLLEAMERWHFLSDHTNSTVFDITHGDKIYTSGDFYRYCDKHGWD